MYPFPIVPYFHKLKHILFSFQDTVLILLQSNLTSYNPGLSAHRSYSAAILQ